MMKWKKNGSLVSISITASWWSRLEVKSDNPWKLLTMAKSNVRNIRLQGVYGLSKKQNWLDAEYRKIGAALDDVTRVGLARCKNVDMRFFEKPQAFNSSQEPLEESFRKLLSSLPMTGLDKCAQYFTAVAMQEGRTAMADVRGGLWCFGGSGLPFATTLSNVPDQKVELYYLQALLRHSELPSHCDVIVQNGGVKLLQELALRRENSLTLLCKICRVIGNLCLHEHLHPQILQSGWVTLLASWMKSKYIPLSMHASRALANLDRDFSKEKYEHGLYIIHPQFRTSEPVVADVIFVHGLLGGAFKTWRQQDPDIVPGEEAPQSVQSFKKRNQSITDCWPKSWLAEDLPHNRIITVEYDTQVSNWTPKCPFESEKRTIASRSSEMLHKLKLAGVGSRPIIWVTHSMGGLLVKQMTLEAESSEEFKKIADQSRGFIFYSTPHKGSPLAAYSQQTKFLLYPSVEVAELSPDSASLQEQHEKFKAFVKQRKIPCFSFGERDSTNIGLGMKLVIVPDSSANPGFGNYKQMPVNHLNVCKPDNIDSELYQLLVCFIDELIPKKVIQEIGEVLDPTKATEEYYFGDMF
ncbi:protein SERAC1-like isoform X2 [Ptychodera flava]|uniref:protein SERAC1-like isoform X2 n=1 Tax=Ptychodera flava TaxID=63121 RepID=UPI00396A15CC